MKLLMWAMVGGALGSGARHAVNVGFGRWVGTGGFPWWTLSVNVVGCCLMGVLVEVLAQKFSGSQEMRTFFATGVLGGFTTFSAFSLDFATLVGRNEQLQAVAYLVASVAASIAAFYAGLWLMRTVLA
jgi:CrcB protein